MWSSQSLSWALGTFWGARQSVPQKGQTRWVFYQWAPLSLVKSCPRALSPCTSRFAHVWVLAFSTVSQPWCRRIPKVESWREVVWWRWGAVRLQLLEAGGHSKDGGCKLSWEGVVIKYVGGPRGVAQALMTESWSKTLGYNKRAITLLSTTGSYFLSTCRVPGTLLNSLHTLSHLFIPATLWDEVETVIFMLVREETVRLQNSSMCFSCREAVCISLERTCGLLVTSRVPLTLRFYDFCESGIKIRKLIQNCLELRRNREREKIWVNEWSSEWARVILKVFFKWFPVYSSWATDLWCFV